jgi:hypothetical protein
MTTAIRVPQGDTERRTSRVRAHELLQESLRRSTECEFVQPTNRLGRRKRLSRDRFERQAIMRMQTAQNCLAEAWEQSTEQQGLFAPPSGTARRPVPEGDNGCFSQRPDGRISSDG